MTKEEDTQTAFERQMAKLNNSVIYIQNPSGEDFSHTFDAIPYTLKTGEKLPFPYPVGMHLAKHLAMRMAREEAKKRGKLAGESDKKAVNLYAASNIQPYIDRIVVKTVEQPLPERVSEAEIMRQKTEDMQRQFKDEVPQASTEVDKKEVVEELRKRGIKFDARSNKDALLQLLIDSEAKSE